jgi:hypothetical protein
MANKLLKYLKNKSVIVAYKHATVENEAIHGILVDMDEEHYYLGGDGSALFVIPKHAVRAIADATDSFELFDESKGTLQ